MNRRTDELNISNQAWTDAQRLYENESKGEIVNYRKMKL